MRPYFDNMPVFGKPLSERQFADTAQNAEQVAAAEEEISRAAEKVKNAGVPVKKLNERGQLSAWQRIEKLVEPGSWLPLNSLYDPFDNEEGSVGLVTGLCKISGRWAVLCAFDNKVLAGAWISGQDAKALRATEIAQRLRIPLIWLVNCSGVKLPDQHRLYAGRRCGGATFFRHAELQQKGVPVFSAIFGTNPAGGGYTCISPTLLLAHKDANMAVGGGGIVRGMSPGGGFNEANCEALIEATRRFRDVPPGRAEIHYDSTGFFRHIYETEQGVLDGVKKYMQGMPAYDPAFFRVAAPARPALDGGELPRIVPMNQKRTYSFGDVLSRLVDGSEHMEFRPGYGPDVYCGLVRIDGFLVGAIGNNQGFLGAGYPEYSENPGIGGKLYRQGLIKMNEFVTLCGRDRIPIVWLQDATGIDVGDEAEKAELLGIGQSLIYSIEQTGVPHMLLVLRKGTAAAHYVMGGPVANNHNAFTIGTVATEIYVMHGETAAVASYARRLVKERDSGNDIAPVVEKMNELVKSYHDHSRPEYCAKKGFVDEIVKFDDIRKYLEAFAGAAYQNPSSICAHHQMILPRIIRG